MSANTRKIDVFVSKRFSKSYRAASLPIKCLSEGAVHDLVRRIRSNPRTVLRQYDQLEHCKARILEVDVCGGFRLLAEYSGNSLALLDLGNHEVVPRYTDSKREVDIRTLEPSPRSFYTKSRSNFFKRLPDKTVQLAYADEITPDWLYFLTDQQQKVLEKILLGLLYEQQYSSIVIGGPGTGKTCILINLLRDLANDFNVGIHLSDALSDYIESATGANISKYRVNLYEELALDVLLVDDPSRYEIERILELKRSGEIESVVFAFDPLQLDTQFSDHEFGKLKYDNKLKVHELTACYRQKANIGENTKHVVDMIADSTPFLAREKIARFKNQFTKLTSVSNNLSFPNPHGYLEVYPEATLEDVLREFKRLTASPGLLWQNRPWLLIVLDRFELSEQLSEIFTANNSDGRIRVISIEDVETIKGLEFQHVFVFIEKALFDEIQNGFVGSGQTVYRQRRLLRIPFSRAKDSLVTFAFD